MVTNPHDGPSGPRDPRLSRNAGIPRRPGRSPPLSPLPAPAEPAKAPTEIEWEENRNKTGVLSPPPSLPRRAWKLLIGRAKNPFDARIFHHLALVAFFAWVGLGADGLSSSCYGPAEAYLALVSHPHLSIFVALGTALTIFVISTSYSQTIALFSGGGGGYLVASKMLSPTAGMVSGCALLIDYVLTISISIASGVDALLSFLPPPLAALKLELALLGVLVLALMNLRGVKESVLPLVPIFLTFVLTHLLIIVYAPLANAGRLVEVGQGTLADLHRAHAEVGSWGTFFLIMKAYSMGAGTYTGIEAVSNGLPILRDPKVRTGKHTMRYMAVSLAVVVLGLMIGYQLYNVQRYYDPRGHQTLNAVLFARATAGWPHPVGRLFVGVALFSEAAILFVASQTGFLDGPRVLSNMALDRWLPHRFANLSDRLVTQNGIVVMGAAAFFTVLLTRGAVGFLVVLYSINVFITFILTETGMVRHWWLVRHTERHWEKKLAINGLALVLDVFILVTVVIVKFHEGGWVTLFFTGALIGLVLLIRRHYEHVNHLLGRLDGLVRAANAVIGARPRDAAPAPPDPEAKTAVLLVNGFNGLGLHTLLNIVRLFGGLFRNFVFVEVGVVDAGNFKGAHELDRLERHVQDDAQRYVDFVRAQGYHGEAVTGVGTDVVDEVAAVAPGIMAKHPQAVFFGGQLVFPRETLWSRWLHNNTVFALQRRFYGAGIPMVILPVRV